jgi:hypothetical protein
MEYLTDTRETLQHFVERRFAVIHSIPAELLAESE